MTDNTIIYTDEFIKILSYQDGVYLEGIKKGCPFDKLLSIITSYPQIEIVSPAVLRNVINSAPKPPEKFGRLKERILIELLENDLKAYITFNMTAEELDMKNRDHLVIETKNFMREKKVVYGIISGVFLGELSGGKKYLLAEGIPPIDGSDSIITMYKLEESKPETHEDGSVDFYELKLINRVKSGDWLGERIDATDGTSGRSVKDQEIRPVKGRSFSLDYDKGSVYEIYENNKTTLFSKIDGAVSFADGKITVSNHLEIVGNVDFKTGNIKFDGYVTIKGTIADGFFVQATKDIEVNGELGVGNIKGILSTGGSIYIKGGVAAKGKTEIQAAKNVFTKFVDNTTIICGETIHIGYYCLNSIISAKQIVIDSSNGHIIGGHIKAEIKVTSSVIGSEIEKRTIVEVTGFDRADLVHSLEYTLRQISELKNEQAKIKLQLSRFDGEQDLNPFQKREYLNFLDRMAAIKIEIREQEDKRKSISEYMKTKGEGEISATGKIYPNCQLILKNEIQEITVLTPATSFYLQDGQLKQAH